MNLLGKHNNLLGGGGGKRKTLEIANSCELGVLKRTR